MKSQSNYATQILSGLLLTSAVALSACGAVQSGFKSDPLSGNEKYQQMRKDGVPQAQAPQQTTQPPKTDSSGAQTPETPAAPSVPKKNVIVVPVIPEAPATDAPVAAPAKIITLKMTLGEVALPETQVMNFVEGMPVRYEITIMKSNGKATAKGLPEGVKLTPLQGDVYEIVWTAPAGTSANLPGESQDVVINVDENRHHQLAIAVTPNNEVPVITKISLNAAAINAGETVGFDVVVAANPKLDTSKLKIVLMNNDGATSAEQTVIDRADIKALVKQDNGTYLGHVTFETKSLPTDAKAALNFGFWVSAAIGDTSSAQISQTISVNPIAKTDDAKKAATSKKATGSQASSKSSKATKKTTVK